MTKPPAVGYTIGVFLVALLFVNVSNACNSRGGKKPGGPKKPGPKPKPDETKVVEPDKPNTGTDTTPENTQLTNSLQGALGGDINAGDYTTGATGDPISQASDLDCCFDSDCRWYNVQGEDQFEYKLGKGRADPKRWGQATGNPEQPDDPFALIAALKSSPNDDGRFVSDPVPCQKSEGIFSFDYWASPSVELTACYRFIGDVEFQQCSGPFTRGGGPRQVVTFPGPINEPFEIVIQAKNFVFGQGGFAFLDCLKYEADIGCNGAEPASPTTTTQAPAGEPVHVSCEKVTCSFDNGYCKYRPVPPQVAQDGEWEITNIPVGNRLTGIYSRPDKSRQGKIVASRFPDMVSQGGQPNPNFRQVLQSEEIDIRQTQRLQFHRYQALQGTVLRVCLDNPEPQNCIWKSSDIAQGNSVNIAMIRQWREEDVALQPGRYKVLFVSEYDSELSQFNTGVIGLADVKMVDRSGNALC